MGCREQGSEAQNLSGPRPLNKKTRLGGTSLRRGENLVFILGGFCHISELTPEFVFKIGLKKKKNVSIYSSCEFPVPWNWIYIYIYHSIKMKQKKANTTFESSKSGRFKIIHTTSQLLTTSNQGQRKHWRDPSNAPSIFHSMHTHTHTHIGSQNRCWDPIDIPYNNAIIALWILLELDRLLRENTSAK